MMIFEVEDMSCGHCVDTITKAVYAVDKEAKVRVDLEHHRVEVEPGTGTVIELTEAIRQAGYTPVLVS